MLSQPKSTQMLSPVMALVAEQLAAEVHVGSCSQKKLTAQARPDGALQVQATQIGAVGKPVLAQMIDKAL